VNVLGFTPINGCEVDASILRGPDGIEHCALRRADMTECIHSARVPEQKTIEFEVGVNLENLFTEIAGSGGVIRQPPHVFTPSIHGTPKTVFSVYGPEKNVIKFLSAGW
jgi:hypothetical protein